MAAEHRPELESPHFAPAPVKGGLMVPAMIAAALILLVVTAPAIGRSLRSRHVPEIPEVARPYGSTVLLNEKYGCTRRAVFETSHPWTTVDFDRMKVRFEAEAWTVIGYISSDEYRALGGPVGVNSITYDTSALGASLLELRGIASHGGALLTVTMETCHPAI